MAYVQLFPQKDHQIVRSMGPERGTVSALEAAQVEAITFDAGGTLAYAHPPVGEVYAAAAARRGFALPPELVHQRFLQAFQKGVETKRRQIDLASEQRFWKQVVREALQIPAPEEVMDEIFQELWEAYASARYWKLFDDAYSTVQAMKARGYRVYLLSNADTRFRRTFLELGLGPLFEFLFISSEIGAEKPDEAIFRYVEQTTGLSGPRLLHVGDSVFHDGGAAACGWQVLILKRDISCLSDLLQLLPGPRKQP